MPLSRSPRVASALPRLFWVVAQSSGRVSRGARVEGVLVGGDGLGEGGVVAELAAEVLQDVGLGEAMVPARLGVEGGEVGGLGEEGGGVAVAEVEAVDAGASASSAGLVAVSPPGAARGCGDGRAEDSCARRRDRSAIEQRQSLASRAAASRLGSALLARRLLAQRGSRSSAAAKRSRMRRHLRCSIRSSAPELDQRDDRACGMPFSCSSSSSWRSALLASLLAEACRSFVFQACCR